MLREDPKNLIRVMPAKEMKIRKNGLFANGLIWFGAATSLAEIEAGLHCKGNLVAVLLGHLFGFVLLFAMGLIGGQTCQTAMQTTTRAFGNIGRRFFAGLNLLQLIGWTAVMVSMGALASTELFPQVGFPVFCLIVGGLAIFGLLIDFKQSSILVSGTIFLLAALAVVLTLNVQMLPTSNQTSAENPSFFSAFELSIAMPLSWLPLISDHTKDAEHPVAVSLVSALTYSIVSVWMYVLGMMIAAADSGGSIAQSILRTEIGVFGLIIVITSTALSAFLDLYSSGESGQALWRRLPPKAVGLTAGLIGIVLAISGIQERYASFLYLIASVFAPMAAVLIVSHYVVRRRYAALNVFSWGVGTVIYHLSAASPLGPTLTALLAASFIASLGLLIQKLK